MSVLEEEKIFDFNQVPGQTKKSNISINDGKPLISIITAYYNSKDYIRQTANSIFNQTFPYWEWIIVNDGSTEKETEEVLKKLAQEDNRIKIYNIDNSGPARARTYGIKKSNTDLVFIMDSDDVIDETFLECGYFSMLSNPGASWCYSNIVNFDKNCCLFNRQFYTEIEKKENVICGNAIIKKEKFLEVEYYSEDNTKNYHEDWQLWLKLLAKGYYPIKMNFYGFWYRQRNGVLQSINKDEEKNRLAAERIKELGKKIKKSTIGVQFPQTDSKDYDNYCYKYNFNRKSIINNQKIKLLFILPWFTVGGADKFNLNLLEGLDKTKYDITIITTESSDYIWRQKAEKHATVFDLNTFLNRKDWAAFIHHIIKSRSIELVMISNSFYGYSVLPWLKYEFPNVIFTDYLHAEDFSWRNGGFPRSSIDYEKIIDKSFTCTNHLANVMYDKMNKKINNTKTVYIGVDEKEFDSNKKSKINFDLYENKKVILFLCRITELKRPIFALKIMQYICKTRNDIVLFVVGDGPELKEMKEKTIQMNLENNVVFFGMKEDTISFYKRADVTLICSLTEGLTITTYESLSMGVPIVSSNVGGQSELINDKTGKIIEAYQNVTDDLFNRKYSKEEIKEYVESIIKILDDKNYEQISNYCRKQIIENYTISKMISTMSLEFEQLINKKTQIKKEDLYSEEESKKILKDYVKLYKIYVFVETNKYKRSIKAFLINTRDKLWQFKFYRWLTKFSSKIGFTKVVKIILRRK